MRPPPPPLPHRSPTAHLVPPIHPPVPLPVHPYPPADNNIVLGIPDPTVFYPPSSCDRVVMSATDVPFVGPKLLNRHKYI